MIRMSLSAIVMLAVVAAASSAFAQPQNDQNQNDRARRLDEARQAAYERYLPNREVLNWRPEASVEEQVEAINERVKARAESRAASYRDAQRAAQYARAAALPSVVHADMWPSPYTFYNRYPWYPYGNYNFNYNFNTRSNTRNLPFYYQGGTLDKVYTNRRYRGQSRLFRLRQHVPSHYVYRDGRWHYAPSGARYDWYGVTTDRGRR